MKCQNLQPVWWSSFLDLRSLEPRKRQIEKFWATRGKRGGDVYIKPNALFTPMYSKMKKNMKESQKYDPSKKNLDFYPLN